MKENKLIIKKSPSKKGEDGYKIFSIRIKEELASQIDTIASETGRSRNELIGKFLEFAISHCPDRRIGGVCAPTSYR